MRFHSHKTAKCQSCGCLSNTRNVFQKHMSSCQHCHDNLNSVRTVSYYVQQLYAQNKGTNVLPLTMNKKPVTGAEGQNGLFASAVYDKDKNELIVKVANTSDKTQPVSLTFEGLKKQDVFHMHTLCEQNSDDLETTLRAAEENFGAWFSKVKWLNLGGGHHITREDYDRERLIRLVRGLREKYGVEVYLEPGEAVVLNAGFLVTSVLETMENGMQIAILDTSAACHMPDVLEMPYRPPLIGAGEAGEKPYTFRLGGPTCLSGDCIGDYSFDAPLKEGGRLVFGDMALYTMVKNNTFNGMPLPSIVYRHEDGTAEVVRAFGYEDFVGRL